MLARGRIAERNCKGKIHRRIDVETYYKILHKGISYAQARATSTDKHCKLPQNEGFSFHGS